MTGGSALTVSALSVAGSDGTDIVRGVSLAVAPGTTTGIVGQSGSGKSLTCRALLGILPASLHVSGGSVDFGGIDLLSLDYRGWRSVRGPRIAAVFQDPASSLNPAIPVGHQLAEAFRVHLRTSRADSKARAFDLFQRIGLRDPARVYQQYSFELSGGMLQRIAIALAVAGEPELLIADEVTTALDVTVQAEILDLLRQLRDELGLGVMFVSHDLAVVAQVSDHVVVMQHGSTVEEGRAGAVFGKPQHAYTQSLVQNHERYGIDRFLQPEVEK